MTSTKYHETVLVSEVIESLLVKKARKYIDATAGNGGHALEIAQKGGLVLGIDLDPEMVKIAKARVGDKAKIVQGNFTKIDEIARQNDFYPVAGIVFDLGVTNIHLKDSARGFSFENPEAELDMRINPASQGVKGSDLLNVIREDQLRQMFEVTLPPGPAKWITGRVLHSRAAKPIKSVGDFLEVCEGLKIGKPGLSEATLPFLALRIAVNSELDNLKDVLPKAFGLLEKGGRLAVISFHSGEDSIVKEFFREKITMGEAEGISFKPIRAKEQEIVENRKSRSAKMRVLQKK